MPKVNGVWSRIARCLVAAWAVVAGTAVSVEHAHAFADQRHAHRLGLASLARPLPTSDNQPTSPRSDSRHRHLILFGVESPAQPLTEAPVSGLAEPGNPAASPDAETNPAPDEGQPAPADFADPVDLYNPRPQSERSTFEPVHVPTCPFARHAVSGVRLT